ncbi:transcriptional regulator [Comamonas odontotermitis]|uniref:transcriptional regulator n=1 Tax=Comamonas odontotermitis TaxID=379895 RepID=UPI001CC713D3|nr:YdaS family helix-turn-helix protein [Comamonas odontotermitis]UBB17779.1 helix-turn-helix domain-containing protein [Comamonas odontotermitis]
MLYHKRIMAKAPNPHFLKAIAVFGSEAALARAIDKPAQFINQIKKGERPMPDSWAPLIELATAEKGNKILCEDLAPSFPWHGVRQQPAHA